MGVYKTKSVYKTPGVYRSGVYKEPSESVLLDGIRYENAFYAIDSDNVGSKFVDTVQLPSGYEKVGRVWYNGTHGNDYPSLIETDFELPVQFGNIYCGFDLVSVSYNALRIFSTQYYSDSYKRTSYYSREQSTSISRSIVWSYLAIDGTFSKSVQLSDENKVKENLLNGTWMNLNNQLGLEPPSRKMWILSSRGLCYFRFLFVADRNRQVTFTAIPCKRGSDYGLFDIVAGKFYSHENLIGD